MEMLNCSEVTSWRLENRSLKSEMPFAESMPKDGKYLLFDAAMFTSFYAFEFSYFLKKETQENAANLRMQL
jgi:hypothetical protein